jgi:hypothetical protein
MGRLRLPGFLFVGRPACSTWCFHRWNQITINKISVLVFSSHSVAETAFGLGA